MNNEQDKISFVLFTFFPFGDTRWLRQDHSEAELCSLHFEPTNLIPKQKCKKWQYKNVHTNGPERETSRNHPFDINNVMAVVAIWLVLTAFYCFLTLL